MDMTVDDLAAMLAKEFKRIYARFDAVDTRFDRVEQRLERVEELAEDTAGRVISIDDRLSRMEFTLDEADPRMLKRRVESLEKRSFGKIQTA